MANELDLKRIITHIYMFKKNIKLLAGHLQVKTVEYDDIKLLHEWKNNQNQEKKIGRQKHNDYDKRKVFDKNHHSSLSNSLVSDAINE